MKKKENMENIMTKHENLKRIFEIGRVIDKDSPNSYIHIAFKRKLKNYRLITSGELEIKGQGLDIPEYMREFLDFHNEAIMIANIINDKVISIVLRSINTKKEFQKIGVSKNMLYGLGDLDDNFTFGTPILLVEGHLDRDVISEYYKNSLAITTNKISNSQAKILKNLTNRFILMLDNDEAGKAGIKDAYYKLKGCKISVIEHQFDMKDCGDLVKLEITNKPDFEFAIEYYKNMINLEINSR